MQILVANTKGGCGKSTLVASLADVLRANIIDHDLQGTIRVSATFTKRHKPVTYGKVTQPVVLHDSPPYHSAELKSLITTADMVLIPCKTMYPDLLALKTLNELLETHNATKKAVVIFNEVRLPHNNTYKEVKKLFKENYGNLRHANTELSNLVAFSRVLAEPLRGLALAQMKALVQELRISKTYLKK